MPKISAVPLRTRSRSGVSLATSIRSSHSLSNFTCRIVDVDADAEPAITGAPMATPFYSIVNILVVR